MNNLRKIFELALIYSVVAIATFLFFSLVFGGSFSAVDVKMYYQYAEGITRGDIPYINTSIEYPPASFAYMLLVYVLSAGNPVFYLPVHMLLMLACFVGALIVSYFISIKMYNDPKRAFITGLLCAASPAAVYFTLLRYDPLPTLILMLSIFLFINGKDVPAYIAAGIGTLVKFFPVVAVPFYIAYRPSKKGLLWFILTLAIGTIPFAIISLTHFLYPYTYNFSRTAQAESIFYLINTISGTTLAADFGSYVLIAALILLFASYLLKTRDTHFTDQQRMHMLIGYITIAVSLTVIFNRVASPQYFLWATPLIAIYLSRNIKTIACFIAFQAITYIQYPLLVDRLFDPTRYYIPEIAVVFFMIKYIIWAIVLIVLWNEMNI